VQFEIFQCDLSCVICDFAMRFDENGLRMMMKIRERFKREKGVCMIEKERII
jgi:methyl coenzyme M reductase gamma subunit